MKNSISQHLVKYAKNKMLLSITICALFFFVIIAFLPVQFIVNDDMSLMYIYAGYDTGAPQPFSTYTYITFGLIVSGLYMLMPQVPWYTVFLLTVMFFSTVAIIFVLLSSLQKCKHPVIMTIVIIGILFCLLLFRLIMFIHFSVVAGFAGSASVVLFFHFKPKDKKHNALYISFIAFFYFLCITIRPETGNLILVLLFCILLYKLIYYFRGLKTHLVTFAMALIVMFSVIMLDNIFKNTDQWREYELFNAQRVRFSDYQTLNYRESPDVFHAVGWDEARHDLAHWWCYTFPEFNKEALSHINNESAAVLGSVFELTQARRELAERTLGILLFSGTYNFLLYFALMCIWGASVLLVSINKQKNDKDINYAFHKISWLKFLNNHKLILSVGIILFFHIVFLYLLLSLRFPDRIFRMMLIIFVPLSLINLTSIISNNQYIDRSKKFRTVFSKIICTGLLIVFIAITGVYSYATPNIRDFAVDKENAARIRRDLDNFAMANPDNVYVYSWYSIGIACPFTVHIDQKPINTIFWGHSNYLSPIWFAQLEAMGRESLLLEDLWEDNIYIVIGNEVEKILLMRYFHQTNPESHLKLIEALPSGINVYRLMGQGYYD